MKKGEGDMNLDRLKCHREPLGIYIHIPFCVKKCDYCDFLSMPADYSVKDIYIEALGKEIKQKINAALFEKYELRTIFIGGGTPTALSAEQLDKLGQCAAYIVNEFYKYNYSFRPDKEVSIESNQYLNKCEGFGSDIEISIECNPGTINREKAEILKKYGINRVSLGLQSANDEELKLLGRIHTFEQFLEAFTLLRDAGIDNVNVDLMSALPGQTVESWEKTLRTAAELSPNHISAYSLIIEEGTPFFDKFAEDEAIRDSGGVPALLPPEEAERKMYVLTKSVLSEYGYGRYEISNYAKSGYECRHNIGYWQAKEYLGLGLGAVSMMGIERLYVRFNNTRDLNKYLSGDFSAYESENLTSEIQMEEFMFLGLRMMQGIVMSDFENKFGRTIYDVYIQQLHRLEEQHLITIENERVFLTEEGISVSNYVFEQFML